MCIGYLVISVSIMCIVKFTALTDIILFLFSLWASKNFASLILKSVEVLKHTTARSGNSQEEFQKEENSDENICDSETLSSSTDDVNYGSQEEYNTTLPSYEIDDEQSDDI